MSVTDDEARDRMLATQRLAKQATHPSQRMYWAGWSDALAWVRHPDLPTKGAT